MHKISLFLIFLIISNLVLAQSQIKVLNAQNDEPLVGATVQQLNTDNVFITDSAGIAKIPEQGRKFYISYVGFKAKKVELIDSESVVFLQPDLQFLKEIEVKGHENNTDYLSIAGSYNFINNETIGNYSHESLVRAVNTIPGVRMEERSPSSYRLSIRGSLLRAPYGVRNVKVYWNGIPFTDPTGNSYLYFLDNENVDKIEVIKGPSGSVYGAGMGGVVLLNSKPAGQTGLHSSVGISAGSFGLKALDLKTSYQDDKVQSDLKYSGLKEDGYRDHTNTRRNVFQSQSIIKNSDDNKLYLNILYSDLFYELPGGLTREEYERDPQQARQISIDQNASIDHQNFLLGIANQHHWGDKWSNKTSVYFSNGTKENPFNTNYELERLQGLGGRSGFVKSSKLFGNSLLQTAGVEFQYGKFHASNHDIDNGYAGALRYEDESKIYQGFVFAQAEYTTISRWIFTIGASLNYLKYDINRLRDVALDSSYSFHRTFNPVFSPRLGVVKRINENVSVHGSISEGFSPPSQEEIRTSDGDINKDLEAERGINYEAGIRGNTSNGKLMFDVTAFYMQQKKTIVSRIEEGGNSAFENAGATAQSGIEALAGAVLIDNPKAFISHLKLQTAVTYNNFEFKDYIKEAGDGNVDFSANDLTGTAPFIAVTSLDLAFTFGGYVFFSHNFTDKIPLNDANTVYSSSYQLVTGKIGWKNVGRYNVDIFAGVDNLLNQKYSLGNDLNAFGNRFYEPSRVRNYYFGIEIYF